MSQSPPQTLGKYQIIREIARSNDIVYEGYDPVMNRRVALKELAIPSGSTDAQRDDRRRRFLREAKAAGSLVHPHIVTVYEMDEDQGRTFIAMEFLDGRTLRQEMDKSGFLEPARAIEIAIAVLEGLSFAHKAGIVHRDVKPENIQLCANGAVKLTDFGIARLTFEPNLTMDGQVFGTPSYMSPEQIRGGDIDARSDIFSVGVVLYEMLGGSKPFTGDHVIAITHAILNVQPPPVGQANHTVQQIVNKCLEKTSSLRYDTADQLILDLKRALQNLGSVVLDPSSGYAAPQAGYAPGGYAPTGYGQPAPPPVLGPTPGMPIQTPYMPGTGQYPSPLGAAYQANPAAFGGNPIAPPGTPYASPYNVAGHMGQAPNTQPYGGQPYGVQPGTPYTGQPGMPYMPGGPPVANIPVYYPPPPHVRRPMSAATKAAWRTFFLALIVVGTLALIVIMGLNALGSTASGSTGSSARPAPTGTPTPASSAQASPAPPVVANPTEPATPNGRIDAPAWDADLVRRDMTTAAELVLEGVTRTSDRDAMWTEAQTIYRRWIQTAPTDQDRGLVEQNASTAFIVASDLASAIGENLTARQALYRAQSFAGNQPETNTQINERLAQLGA